MHRDIRIDFLRGIVLLLIVADHVVNNESTWFALGDWLYFDCAAVFVFISGLVCGMAYGKALTRHGLLHTQRKSLKRCVQLYVAQLAVLASVCILFAAFSAIKPLSPEPFGLSAMFADPIHAIPNALTLHYTPWLMDILKLYIVLLALLPLALWIYQRSRFVALTASLGLYFFAQKFPDVSPREFPHGLGWFWNPLAWQLLFFGPAFLGVERVRGLRLPARSNSWLLPAAIGLGVVIVLCRTRTLDWFWTDRQKLAPMHVFSFALVSLLFSSLPDHLLRQWLTRSRWVQPIIHCGQHSLTTFCTGVVVDYLMSMLLEPIHSSAIEAMVVATGVGATLVVAISISRLMFSNPDEQTSAWQRPLIEASRPLEPTPDRDSIASSPL